jgi:Flp pilus assembly protein TadG
VGQVANLRRIADPPRRRGFVLITMAVAAAGVLAVAGLAVDIGRVFIAKNEIQVACDAAALAAAGQLDGTENGIARAQQAVTSAPNKWNFGTADIPAPAVTFATSPAGPWIAGPNPAAGYAYVQVTAAVQVRLYFMALATGQSVSNVNASAKAGQIPIASVGRGLAPYTAVSTNTTGPNFGFVAGNSYTMQWPTFNSSRSGCSAASPSLCFNSPPCAGESQASQTAVVANWASKYQGYWGANSNSLIAAAVMDGIQLAPLTLGQNINPLLSPGDKQSEADYLDRRASQDTDTTDPTPAAYLASTRHNGRRLLAVAVVNPVDSTHTSVIGYGQFLLIANGSPSDYYKKTGNGNDPYCALYAGPYNIGSGGPGAGGSSGASSVRLVE